MSAHLLFLQLLDSFLSQPLLFSQDLLSFQLIVPTDYWSILQAIWVDFDEILRVQLINRHYFIVVSHVDATRQKLDVESFRVNRIEEVLQRRLRNCSELVLWVFLNCYYEDWQHLIYTLVPTAYRSGNNAVLHY